MARPSRTHAALTMPRIVFCVLPAPCIATSISHWPTSHSYSFKFFARSNAGRSARSAVTRGRDDGIFVTGAFVFAERDNLRAGDLLGWSLVDGAKSPKDQCEAGQSRWRGRIRQVPCVDGSWLARRIFA